MLGKFGAKWDKTAGVGNQLAVGIKPMQFEIFVTRHEPLLAEISVIRGDAANVDSFGIPIRALTSSSFCSADQQVAHCTSAPLTLYEDELSSRPMTVMLGIAAPRRFAQQVTIHAPTRSRCDDQIRFVFVE